jgi:osmotically-inducible protein OsmY
MFTQHEGKPDAQLAQDVAAELWWDARTRDSNIVVAVKDGFVRLRGHVPNVEAMQAAEVAARRVYGVHGIANEVTVDTPPSRPKARRQAPPAPPARARQSEPQHPIPETPGPGWVLLTGVVGSEQERAETEQAVARMPGVLGVVNELVVQPDHPNAEQLRETTEEALLQRIKQELLGLHFNVDGGTVTVAGWVDSPSERHAILAALATAPGVTEIKDAIRVDPWTG